MILERFPEVAQLPEEEKRQLVNELCEDLYGVPEGEEDPAITALLEARLAEYEANPDSASPWPEVRQRLLAALK
jgi:putative addiction module component (TIGR02574 family)